MAQKTFRLTENERNRIGRSLRFIGEASQQLESLGPQFSIVATELKKCADEIHQVISELPDQPE